MVYIIVTTNAMMCYVGWGVLGNMAKLSNEDLVVGHVYRGKCRRKTRHALYNDRKIIWRDEKSIQYDGPAVALGARYPIVSVEQFLAWAKCDEIKVN